jgi:hypothetical protein
LTRLGRWNGNGFDFQDAPAAAGPWGRQTMTLDELGIVAPTTIQVRSVSMFDDFIINTQFYDFAPDDGSAFGVVVSFSSGGGTGPGTNPGPGPNPGAGANPERGSSPQCKVPKVRGLKVRRAKAKLRATRCRSRIVHVSSHTVPRGRVTGTSPRAGRTTMRRVVLRISRGR